MLSTKKGDNPVYGTAAALTERIRVGYSAALQQGARAQAMNLALEFAKNRGKTDVARIAAQASLLGREIWASKPKISFDPLGNGYLTSGVGRTQQIFKITPASTREDEKGRKYAMPAGLQIMRRAEGLSDQQRMELLSIEQKLKEEMAKNPEAVAKLAALHNSQPDQPYVELSSETQYQF